MTAMRALEARDFEENEGTDVRTDEKTEHEETGAAKYGMPLRLGKASHPLLIDCPILLTRPVQPGSANHRRAPRKTVILPSFACSDSM